MFGTRGTQRPATPGGPQPERGRLLVGEVREFRRVPPRFDQQVSQIGGTVVRGDVGQHHQLVRTKHGVPGIAVLLAHETGCHAGKITECAPQPRRVNVRSMLNAEVLAYYERGGEATRLDGTLELVRTQVLLERLLPAPPATVLDVGGAFGVYSSWLAERGYDVRLVDPVPLHVDTVARQGIQAVLGDARDLAEPDESRDVVLLFGPLYHLLDRADRVRALAEARRVVRHGGLVLAVGISRWAPLYQGLLGRSIDIPGFVGMAREAIATGVRHGPFGAGDNFTTAYFHRPEDFAAEVADAGLVLDAQYAVEGVAGWMPDIAARLSEPDERALILELVASTEREPAVLGATSHLLAAAHR